MTPRTPKVMEHRLQKEWEERKIVNTDSCKGEPRIWAIVGGSREEFLN